MNAKYTRVLVVLVIGLVLLTSVPVKAEGTYQTYLPLVMDDYQTPPVPGITISYIHECRQEGSISGTTENVYPSDYKIAVYIYSSGWWNKPYWVSPLTDINPDGTWTTDVTTGGNDTMATNLRRSWFRTATTRRSSEDPQIFPQELYDNAAAYDIKERDCPLREISFSGYTWYVTGFNRANRCRAELLH